MTTVEKRVTRGAGDEQAAEARAQEAKDDHRITADASADDAEFEPNIIRGRE